MSVVRCSSPLRAGTASVGLLALWSFADTAVAQSAMPGLPKAMAIADTLRAVGAGALSGIFLSGLIAAVSKAGLSPLPKPLCVAFMECALHRPVGLTTALGFNLVWVVLWSLFYVFLFWNSLTLASAAGFAAVLWLLTQVFFFPSVGWGFFGSRIGPLASLDAAISYALFAVVMWALNLAAIDIGRMWRWTQPF